MSDPADNGGPNQLRTRINAAQSTGGGKITFSTGAATVTLNNSLPAISANVTIDGGGIVGISGNNAYNIFTVNGGATLNLNNLTLSRAYSPAADGGAVRNYGTLNVTNCLFTLNNAAGGYSGGAILTYGELNLAHSEFSFNTGANGGAVYPRFPAAITRIVGCNFHENSTSSPSDGWGGAVLAWDGAPVTAYKTLFQNNTARTGGGAVYLQGGSMLNATSCRFSGNFCQGSVVPVGGAIYSAGTLNLTGCSFTNCHAVNGGAIYTDGTTTINRGSFSRNWATSGGGAVWAHGTWRVNDSTFSQNGFDAGGNPATAFAGAIGNLGYGYFNRVTIVSNYASSASGFYNNAYAYLQNATITGNSAGSSGAAIYLGTSASITSLTNVTVFQNTSLSGPAGFYAPSSPTPVVALKNTLFAGNTGGNSSMTFASASFCLSDDNTCGFGAGRDNVANILLGPLANNGGATFTHLPQPGSAAIDNGTALGAPLLDQRGFMRAGAAPDVGAVESSGQPMTITSIRRLANGSIALTGKGLPSYVVGIQGSPDVDSNDFETFGYSASDASGVWQFTDLPDARMTNRFYRTAYAY